MHLTVRPGLRRIPSNPGSIHTASALRPAAQSSRTNYSRSRHPIRAILWIHPGSRSGTAGCCGICAVDCDWRVHRSRCYRDTEQRFVLNSYQVTQSGEGHTTSIRVQDAPQGARSQQLYFPGRRSIANSQTRMVVPRRLHPHPNDTFTYATARPV